MGATSMFDSIDGNLLESMEIHWNQWNPYKKNANQWNHGVDGNHGNNGNPLSSVENQSKPIEIHGVFGNPGLAGGDDFHGFA